MHSHLHRCYLCRINQSLDKTNIAQYFPCYKLVRGCKLHVFFQVYYCIRRANVVHLTYARKMFRFMYGQRFPAPETLGCDLWFLPFTYLFSWILFRSLSCLFLVAIFDKNDERQQNQQQKIQQRHHHLHRQQRCQ